MEAGPEHAFAQHPKDPRYPDRDGFFLLELGHAP